MKLKPITRLHIIRAHFWKEKITGNMDSQGNSSSLGNLNKGNCYLLFVNLVHFLKVYHKYVYTYVCISSIAFPTLKNKK